MKTAYPGKEHVVRDGALHSTLYSTRITNPQLKLAAETRLSVRATTGNQGDESALTQNVTVRMEP